MIPVKLKMRNFMCYRDNVPPLHFDGIHTACLSGDNGNGKSAVIDAMTWALWGKARADSDDDLIYAGQAEMEVEFDFNVGQQLYRIIRKRSRPKKRGGAGQSLLEFQIGNGNGFRPITGNTINQTQQKISDTLHMDYDTFVNSAYLRQGHADEFTRQAPAKRKEVLGSILGLSIYDELEERAKELARKQETARGQLESAIAAVNDELAQKPAYEAEMAQAQEELSRVEAAAVEKEAGLAGLRQKKEAMEGRKAQLDELERRIGSTAKDLERWEAQARQHQARIREFEEVIGRRAAVEEGYASFTAVRKINDEFYEKSQKSIRLERQRAQLEKDIDRARNELLRKQDIARQKIEEMEARAARLPELQGQLGEAQTQMQALAGQEKDLKEREEAAQAAQRQASFLEAEIKRLEREIAEVAEKLDILAKHRESHTDARCPLCESELTQAGLAIIEQKYQREQQTKTTSLEENRGSLARQLSSLQQLKSEHGALEAGLKEEQKALNGRMSVLQQAIAEIEGEEARLAKGKEYIAGIIAQMERGEFAAAEQTALAAIETELVGLGYDADRHEQARRQMGQLEKYEHDKRRLDEAGRLIQPEKDAVSMAGEAAKVARDSLKRDGQKKEALTAELTGLPQLLASLAEAESEHQALAARRSRAQEAVGSIKAKIQRCAELEIKKKEREAEITRAAREENIYKELAKAFGKGGIQALLIETALPEIENEANRLLGRMTDNRMHVKFETQRETKAGTIRETLDINIADELGTRNYEMFSGGEAFRINFAIRIALSRLLARRAGAPLPTLIIDEGFGTQDSTGVEKLKEAINSIQGDFVKILVITHMDELKDSFPTRIDIVKTAEGSTITVNS